MSKHDSGKRLSSKYKICRRYGENLWGRPKRFLTNRLYGPGEHGQSRRRRPTDYGIQLAAKQKLKGYYGNMTERQFRRTYEEAYKRRGDTIENMIGLLERRLDMAIYRMKFVPTVFAARQFVNHGHVRVNGRKVDIPSYRVAPEDAIEIKESSRELPLVLEAVAAAERDVPDYMEVDFDRMKGAYRRVPIFAEVPYPVRMEPNLVIEYYSKA